MPGENETVKLLGEALSYWKAHLSAHDVLASELAYSLIYDNIRPDKIEDAMSTVGLSTLPNRFFLIQVDDYLNHANKLRFTQEFFQKVSLLKLLRNYMAEQRIEGFAANQVGQEKIVCFLCFPEHSEEASEALLRSIAESFKTCIRENSPYTISVCISERCKRLVHYSQMYPKMNVALSRSYFSGKELSILLRDVAVQLEQTEAPASAEYYAEFLASIMRRNPEQFERCVRQIIQSILDTQKSPQKVRLEMIRLIQRTEEYCISCGVPAGRMRLYDDAVISRVLTCNYVADMTLCFQEYFNEVTQALSECGGSKDLSFTAPVCEYIAEHYRENIRVKDLADIMSFSEGHFARSFRAKFGMSFVDYLTQFRLEKSKQLLIRTEMPVEQIAYRVGFNNYSYFCTCFKKKCGVSPSVYRKRNAAVPESGNPLLLLDSQNFKN